ncbi:Zn(2)-C6 fungal-type domain-containing protein [Mycena kentingensis (nom. inval.)]|nr:Zn(2)-C6 fungal-type domain-containing protein [Mycena kentingensis (nom. inval.)]
MQHRPSISRHALRKSSGSENATKPYHYFQTINWTRYPISERDFRVSYSEHGTNGVNAPSDVSFLPLLFAVLAISVRLAPDSIAGDARTRRVTSLRYYWSSRRSLLIAAVIQPDSLDIVLTRLLSARFLTFDRRITECYSQLGAAVKTAQALGLHRDGANMNMEPHLVEYRRRIWSYLYQFVQPDNMDHGINCLEVRIAPTP